MKSLSSCHPLVSQTTVDPNATFLPFALFLRMTSVSPHHPLAAALPPLQAPFSQLPRHSNTELRKSDLPHRDSSILHCTRSLLGTSFLIQLLLMLPHHRFEDLRRATRWTASLAMSAPSG